MKAYEELRIRLRRIGTQRYLAVANGAAAGAAVLHLGDEPARLREAFDALADTGPDGAGPASRAGEIGAETFRLLFDGPLSRCLATARAAQRSRGLRLRFDLPAELADLPVETLCAPSDGPEQTFAFDANLSLVRTLGGIPVHSRLPAAEDPPEAIRTLIAVASPEGLPPLGGDAELAELSDLLPEFSSRQEVVRHATRARIEEWLEEQRGPAAVHLIAHGEHDRSGGIGGVVLETAGGAPDVVPGDLLGGMLVNAPKLRLVVLNLRQSARSGLAEPFSGLAEALIGRGIPAVVGMRGPAAGEAARRIGPLIIDGLCANKTVDEAVVSARQRIARPDAAAAEWGAPTLFMHEDCGHGWLFKAREVRDHGTDDDFLGAGRTAADLVEGDGDVSLTTVLEAARFRRHQRDWQAVLRTVKVPRPNASLKLLKQEAQLELALPGLDRVCRELAAEHGAGAARALFDRTATGLPRDVRDLLDAEIAASERLHGLMASAAEAEAAKAWDGAAAHYRQVLAERGRGFGDAEARLRAAAEEASLDDRYATAVQYEEEGRWEDARAQFERILSARPQGFRDADGRAAYAGGRIGEAAEDWERTAADYERCGDYADAAARLAFARGRMLADAGAWAEARRHLEAAAEAGFDLGHWPRQAVGRHRKTAAEARLDIGHWIRYAEARAAEAEGDWEGAAARYASLDGFDDSARRAALAAGHLARAAGDWLAAAERFDQVPDLAPPLGPVHAGLRTEADRAEAAGEWGRAAACLGRLPEGAAVAERRAYCEARALELEHEWGRAADRYRSTGYADADRRGRYAEGRRAETAGDWERAGECFAALPLDTADAAARVKYAAGRAADARGAWAAAIGGFADLADDFAGGEVGHRRRYARAATAAADGEWAAVAPLLGDTPDEAREGAVGRLRRRARTELAEREGDWAKVADTLHGSGSDDRDEERGRRYAELRAAFEDPGTRDWAAVLDLGADLPDDYRDVRLWRGYARALQAARDRRWADVLEECDGLPEGFGDSGALARRAELHRLFDREDWPAVADLAARLDGDADAPAFGAYARGRLAEQDRDWTAAARAHRSCPGLADSDVRAAYADARRLEEAGLWTAAIAAFADSGLPESAARAERLRRLRRALPWAERLLTSALVLDPLAAADPAYPYTALADGGIGPDSSASDVDDAPFALMRRGGMTAEARRAWDRLRDPARRLLADAQTYRSRDAAALGRALSALGLDEEGDLRGRLCALLPEEAPLFALLSGDREAAVEQMRRRAAEDPGDMVNAHRLAVATLWRARELEQIGAWEAAEDAWRTSLPCWAALIGDDDHWAAWGAARAECYGRPVTPSDVWRLRTDLGAHLVEILTGYAERHTRGGRAGLAGRGRALVGLLEAEMEAARVLREAGGLALADDADRTIAPGPGYLAIAGLQDDLARLVAALDADDGADETVTRRLRWSFSQLAAAFTAYERHRYDAAIQALPAFHRLPRAEQPPDCEGPGAEGHGPVADCAHCRERLALDPAYARLPHRRVRRLRDAVDLAIRIRLFNGQNLLADGRTEEAMHEFGEAVAVSAHAAASVKTRKDALRIILGRANYLAESDDRRHTRLEEAIRLLEAAPPVAGPVGAAELDRERARRLVDRTLHRWSADRAASPEPLLPDMRRALDLDPGAGRAIESHARFLVMVSQRTGADRTGARWELMVEALERIEAAIAATGLGTRVRSALLEVLDEVTEVGFSGLPVPRIAAIVGSYSESDTPGSLVARAESRRLAGDVTRAVDDLVRAVRMDPAHAAARKALIEALTATLASGGRTA